MTVSGYWLPHTSSIDFCEPDYLLTSYVAEPFNAASSFFITFLGLCGMLYSNPSKEWMFHFNFVLLAFIGLGSVALHTTLHWFPQSLDEVPMLWFDIQQIYIMIHLTSTTTSNSPITGIAFFVLTVVITLIYYRFQTLYAAFLTAMIGSSIIVIYWSITIVFFHKEQNTLIKQLWIYSITSFILVAFSFWLIDMNLCTFLLPYYIPAWGWTVHVIWHISAGYGGYLQILLLIAARYRELHKPLILTWRFYIIPVLKEIKDSK